MIKAVIFDVDGVLLDSFEANFQFFEKLFREEGFTPPTRKECASLFHLPVWDVIKSVTHLTDENEIKRIWSRVRDEEFDTIDPELSIGAEEVVKQLSQNYLLAIATSRIKPYETPLEKLQPYFKVTMAYEDTVNHKPHPEPLLLVAKKLKVTPEECVYVGDAESDAIAARAARMKIIIYSKDEMARVDAQTADFSKIPEIIKNL